MASQQQAFRIRWGKLALALVGALALIAVPVTFVVACVTTLTFWTPLVCLALVAVCFVGLRTSALHQRRRRAWQRAASAVSAQDVEAKDAAADRQAEVAPAADASTAEDADNAVKADVAEKADETTAEAKSAAEESALSKPEVAFDVEASTEQSQNAQSQNSQSQNARSAENSESTDSAGSAASAAEAAQADAAASQPESAAQRGADVRTEAEPGVGQDAEAGQDAGESATKPAAKASSTTWSPREIPAPTYTTAEPVERALPGALEQPEEKKPSEVTSIRQAERDRAEAERESETAAATGTEQAAGDNAGGRRLDLDAVLQRRRA